MVYGTLAPGQSNHHVVASLGGRWLPGTVRGHRRPGERGSALGYPGLILDAAAPSVPVQLFVSAELPRHWTRLDAFEGADYARVPISVATAEGKVDAWVYALLP